MLSVFIGILIVATVMIVVIFSIYSVSRQQEATGKELREISEERKLLRKETAAWEILRRDVLTPSKFLELLHQLGAEVSRLRKGEIVRREDESFEDYEKRFLDFQERVLAGEKNLQIILSAMVELGYPVESYWEYYLPLPKRKATAEENPAPTS